MAISNGVNDSGMFELNFNDERYLPFEGTGAVSDWTLTLPKASNRIDFSSISDVIIQIKYTATDGGEAFKQAVTELDAIRNYSGNLVVSMKQYFPVEWQQLKNTDSETMTFAVTENMFPTINYEGDLSIDSEGPVSSVISDNSDAIESTLTVGDWVEGNGDFPHGWDTTDWVLTFNTSDLQALDDVYLVIPYACQLAW